MPLARLGANPGVPMKQLLPFTLSSITALALLAPNADAQGLSVSFGKKTKHGGLALTYTTGAKHCAPVHIPPPRVWVPGHYATRFEQVFVPGATQRVWVPPVYEWRYDACGRAYQACVQPGHYRTVCSPGRYETRPVQVWVDGHWR